MADIIRPTDLFRNTSRAVTNNLRLLKHRPMDYVVLNMHGAYPERSDQPRRRFPLSLLPWPPPPASVESLIHQLDSVAADPRPRGVVLVISGLSAGSATLASLRQAIQRFRRAGKRAVAYLHDISTGAYYLATACDDILTPESASFRAAGLWSETLFLKDTLSLAGIEADFEAIAEYKVTPDTFRRAEMTEPHREMLDSILDSLYAEIVGAIADGRALPPDRVQALLDTAPLNAEEALEARLLDGVCYQDELPARLGKGEGPATLLAWDQARRRLVRARRWHSRRAVGIISVEGTIVPGPSRQPPLPLPLPLPFGPQQAGSDTIVQQLRAAAQNKHLAAVVLHVDSPGGSALASDLIWREVSNLRKLKPVVVYMGNQAASGGYYVSAAAHAIIAQPTTLTGSIGIWAGKFVTRGLFEKIGARREVVSRGRSAGLYADSASFSDEERAKIRHDIGAGYARFKARVAEGRRMTAEEVEAIARGRVWTGDQALAHGLVDQLGDLQVAADRARDLAGIRPGRYAPLVRVPTPKQYHLPLAGATEAKAWFEGAERLLREGVYALAPWTIRIGG